MAIVEFMAIGTALTQLLLRTAELHADPNGNVAAAAVGDVANVVTRIRGTKDPISLEIAERLKAQLTVPRDPDLSHAFQAAADNVGDLIRELAGSGDAVLAACRKPDHFYAYVLDHGGRKIWRMDTDEIAERFFEDVLAAAAREFVRLAPTSSQLLSAGLAQIFDELDGIAIDAKRSMGVAEEVLEGVNELLIRTSPAVSGPVLAVKPLTGREVIRSGPMDELRQLLLDAKSMVGVTTALRGTGGFGKTTIARMLAHDPDVRAAFPDGIIWVDVGESLTGPDLASRIADVVWKLTGTKPPLSDPLLAGTELGRAMGSRRLLLIIDDVWTSAQLEPFTIDGPATVRLVTTRHLSMLPDNTRVVTVDAMTDLEATALILSGLDTPTPVPHRLVKDLLEATGRWALLLGLANAAARSAKPPPGRDLASVWAERELKRIHLALVTDGPTVLDIGNPEDRSRAVSATIGVSLALLTEDERARYLELAVFGEDVEVPRSVLERYWAHTASWSAHQTDALCRRLDDLTLVAEYSRENEPRVRLHDVIRAFLRSLVSGDLPQLHRHLVDAHRSLVPTQQTAAWWELPAEESYIWDWLCQHLSEGQLRPELTALLLNPKYLVAQLRHGGPAALEADLSLGRADPSIAELEVVTRQNAHLLSPTCPPGDLAATLASRLDHLELLSEVADGLRANQRQPMLRPVWPMPDLPHPSLRRALAGHTRQVSAVAIAPDCGWLATTSDDCTARIWDPITGAAVHTLAGHTRPVSAVAIAPDCGWLATTSDDGTARIWDPITGAAVHTLAGHTRPVNAVAIAPDGAWLATTSDDCTARIWDPITGALRHALGGHTSRVRAVAIAPDGAWLATTSNDRTARIWDPITGAPRHTLAGHTGRVRAVAIAPDGAWLVTTSDDGTARIWDAETGDSLHTLTGHTSRVSAVAIAPDGAWLVTASDDGTARIWDAETGDSLQTLTCHASCVRAVAIAPDGAWLVTTSDDGTARISDPRTGDSLNTLTGHAGCVRAVAIAPDGAWLVTTSDARTARTWDPINRGAPHTSAGHTGRVNAVAVSRDGAWFATASNDRTARIWDSTTGSTLHTLTGHTSRVSAVAVAPDGTWLVTTSNDGTARIWDPVSGAPLHTLTHTSRVSAVAVAPDGTWLVTTSADRTARIWDPVSGAPLHTLTGHIRSANTVAIAPDGGWLVTAGSDGTARIWDPVTGASLHTLTGHTDWVRAVAIAPDGGWLVTASNDGTARIWDPVTGASLHTLTGHTDWVRAVAIAPDGGWLVTASNDGTARIWDPVTGASLHTLTGHTDWVRAVAIAPDGGWLATTSADRTIRVWDKGNDRPLASLQLDGPCVGLWYLPAEQIVVTAAQSLYVLRYVDPPGSEVRRSEQHYRRSMGTPREPQCG